MSGGAGRDRRPVWSSGYGGRDSRHKTQNGLATAPKKRHEQICPTGRCWSLRYISPQQSLERLAGDFADAVRGGCRREPRHRAEHHAPSQHRRC